MDRSDQVVTDVGAAGDGGVVVGVGEVLLGERERVLLADEHDAWRPLPPARECARHEAVTDEHERREQCEHREVEPGHQVTVERDERRGLHGDADPDRERHPGEPRSPAEPRLAFVQSGEVVDGEVDRGRDREADQVVRERVGRPIGAVPHEADQHHQRVEGDRVEHAEHAEAVPPQVAERTREHLDHPDDGR